MTRVVVQRRARADSQVGVEHGRADVLADPLHTLEDGPELRAVFANRGVGVVADVRSEPVGPQDVHVQVLGVLRHNLCVGRAPHIVVACLLVPDVHLLKPATDMTHGVGRTGDVGDRLVKQI